MDPCLYIYAACAPDEGVVVEGIVGRVRRGEGGRVEVEEEVEGVEDGAKGRTIVTRLMYDS